MAFTMKKLLTSIFLSAFAVAVFTNNGESKPVPPTNLEFRVDLEDCKVDLRDYDNDGFVDELWVGQVPIAEAGHYHSLGYTLPKMTSATEEVANQALANGYNFIDVKYK